MECPSCKTPITGPEVRCGACGYQHEPQMQAKLVLYFELREEVNRLKYRIKDEVWEGIKSVANKMERYEAILDAELTQLASQTQQVRAARPATAAGSSSVELDRPVPAAASGMHAAPGVSKAQTAPSPPPSAAKKKTETPDFEVNLGQKWLLIIGIATMVFGVGYFLKYSFEQGWIGPAGRVAMAYVWGIVFLVAGDLFRKRAYETYGLYLAGGGIATLYFATFAAFQLYHLLGQFPSAGVMVLITALAVALAVVYDTKWLAMLGLVGGFMTPLLLGTAEDNQIALMTYLTVLNVGLLGIAFYKKWDILNIAGFIFTCLLYALWFLSHYDRSKFWPSILFLNLFYLIYSVIPFAYQFIRKESEKMEGFLLILPNSLLAFGGSYYMIRDYAGLEWVSVVTISYAVLFLSMATYLMRQGKQDQEAFIVLVGKAALFLAITVPVIFSKHWITIFWSMQAAALLWVGLRLDRRPVIGCSYLLLAIVAAKFLLYDYAELFSVGVSVGSASGSFFHLLVERLLTTASVLAALFAGAHLARGSLMNVLGSRGEDGDVLRAAGGVVLFVALNVETSLFFGEFVPAARFAAISVLWTLFSVLLMVFGFTKKNALLRRVALGLFGVTLAKVFLFDMANISTPYRIISFIILGLVLVGTSYLYYRFKGRILDAISTEKS